VAYYEREAKRQPDPNDECGSTLSEDMCEFEQVQHAGRATVLEYIRDHIEGGEVYRLGAADVAFGETLPETPAVVEEEEYERKVAQQEEVEHAS